MININDIPPMTDDSEIPTAEQLFRGRVDAEKNELRIRRLAKQELDDETKPPQPWPPVKSLSELLAEPDLETPYLIDGLAPAGGRTMLSAQWKSGKTIGLQNLVRSLADGDPFLDHFPVAEPKHHIVLIDDELPENTMRSWLRAQAIHNKDGVADVVALRGKVGTFDLLNDRCRGRWATRLRDVGCDYLAFDCLRPVLDALGLDESHDAGTFLVAFDALLTDAGIEDALIVHHMGHNGERARGDSRLLDWPDAVWKLVRESDDPSSARYFSAYGRDVDVPEGKLTFDPVTRRLSYASGSRAAVKIDAALQTVFDILADESKSGDQGLSKRAIEDAGTNAGNHTRQAIRHAIEAGVRQQVIIGTPGARRAMLHRIAHPCPECHRPTHRGDNGQLVQCGMCRDSGAK